MTDARLDWDGGSAVQYASGGMLGDLCLSLPDGRRVRPLARAPWLDEAPLPEGTPGILRGLQGDFACVPFGTGDPAPLPGRWRAMGLSAPPQDPPHGFGANHDWQVDTDAGSLGAWIGYPCASPVARLSRRLTPAGPARVEMALTIEARRDCRLPVALHPIFRLATRTRLCPATPGPVLTHPCGSATDPCPLLPDAAAPGLESLPGRDGGTLDFSLLPRKAACECRLLLPASGGGLRLDHIDLGWSVTLEWDAGLLPGLMLWVSNRGRTMAPWNGRHLALGVEPCCAAFDLGAAVSAAENPLAGAGIPTALALGAGAPLTIRYAISVAALPGDDA